MPPRTQHCIYCFSERVELSDEHVVPAGLGGDRIIPKASCAACRDKTSRIELRVLRHSYGLRAFRSAAGIGNRRASEKPTSAPVLIGSRDAERQVLLGFQDHPVPLSLPLFNGPTELTGADPPSGIRVRGYHSYAAGATSGHLANKLGPVGEVRLRYRNYDHDFAKLLAKIAYCAWILEYGLTSLADACFPSILDGHTHQVGRFVGTLDYALRGSPEAPCLHSVHLSVDTKADPRVAYARIQLFLQLTPSPTYLVVVGRLPNHAKVDPQMQEWQLPRAGMLGKPLSLPLPRWVGTTQFGEPRPGHPSQISGELEAIGLVSPAPPPNAAT
jgi:hypothetical protein